MSLAEEVKAARYAQRQQEKERTQHNRDYAFNQLGNALGYTFGQKPDDVYWHGSFGATALVENIRMTVTYESATPTLAVVCTCKECGQDFLSSEKFGSDKNHYSSMSERPLEERRERAVEQIAKAAARDFQPNGYGHDHKCDAVVTMTIPVRLARRVEELLNEHA